MSNAHRVYRSDPVTQVMLGLVSNGFLQPPKAESMSAEDIMFYGTLVSEFVKSKGGDA